MKKLKVLLALGLCLVCLPKIDSLAYYKTYQVYDPLEQLSFTYESKSDLSANLDDPLYGYLPKGAKTKVISYSQVIEYSKDGEHFLGHTFTYDSAGNVILEKCTVILNLHTPVNYNLYYSYDSKGRIIQEQADDYVPYVTNIVYDDTNNTINYTFTNLQDPTRPHISFNYVYQYQLNENGKVSAVIKQDVLQSEASIYTYTYSPEGYVTGISVTNGDKTHIYTYTYDAMGNPLTVSEDGNVTKEYKYTYDSCGRVISDGYYTYTYY